MPRWLVLYYLNIRERETISCSMNCIHLPTDSSIWIRFWLWGKSINAHAAILLPLFSSMTVSNQSLLKQNAWNHSAIQTVAHDASTKCEDANTQSIAYGYAPVRNTQTLISYQNEISYTAYKGLYIRQDLKFVNQTVDVHRAAAIKQHLVAYPFVFMWFYYGEYLACLSRSNGGVFKRPFF